MSCRICNRSEVADTCVEQSLIRDEAPLKSPRHARNCNCVRRCTPDSFPGDFAGILIDVQPRTAYALVVTGKPLSRVRDASVPKLAQKKDWTLSPPTLRKLLRWLDEATESDGHRYLEMRRRLVAYFDRKNCPASDELADETLSRVARRLEEEGAIESEAPARYCYIVARFVFMEHLRKSQKERAALDDIRRRTRDNAAASEVKDQKEFKEKILDCLEQCTAKLEASNREVITRYYTGKQQAKIDNRRALAESLGITMNALSIRACRIRDKLEVCVRQCSGA